MKQIRSFDVGAAIADDCNYARSWAGIEVLIAGA